MAAKNKVSFGLSNVHYAVVTETRGEDGKYTSSYGTPIAWPGAVSLELSQEGSIENFYADDIAYYTTTANAGYSGSLECALIPDEIFTDVFGMVKGTDNTIAEYSDINTKYIALLFEVNGDQQKRKFCFYRCMLTRPNVASETTTDSKTPKTQSIDINAVSRPDDQLVKIFADDDASSYATWYDSVPVPAARS